MSHTAPYPNDSLRWVAAEIRYPPLDGPAVGSSPDFRERLRERFPIREAQPQLSVTLTQGGPSAQQVVQQRFVRRDRLMSVTAGRDVITLETTEYPGWTELRGELMEVVRALQETSAPDGITRVGLRYIDEIRLPNEPDTLAGWSGWVDERLVAPFTLEHEPGLSSGTIVLQYGEVPGYVTLFRAGPLQSGRAVQQQGGPLRTPYETPEGAFFLLDTDASWADPTGQIPEFEPAGIEEVVNQLHESCHTLFEASITDRLRQEVLRRTREEVWGA